MLKKSYRVDNEKSFILNSIPWSESSLLIEVFTKNHGKLTLIARGARKITSQLRGLIILFIPINISFFGNKNQVLTLHKIDWIGGWPQLKGKTIISGFYVNELITKLLPKEDVNPKIFEYLEKIMKSLSLNSENQNYNLRIFEWNLLQATGFIPNFKFDDKNLNIKKDSIYLIKPNSLPKELPNDNYKTNDQEIIITGDIIINLLSGIIKNDNDLNHILKLNRILLQYIIDADINTKFLFNQFHFIKNKINSKEIK